jgi:hypothetical protein
MDRKKKHRYGIKENTGSVDGIHSNDAFVANIIFCSRRISNVLCQPIDRQ